MTTMSLFPISLFIVCDECLSFFIQKAKSSGKVHGRCVAWGAHAVTHLFFVDDNLPFFKANNQEATEVKRE